MKQILTSTISVANDEFITMDNLRELVAGCAGVAGDVKVKVWTDYDINRRTWATVKSLRVQYDIEDK